MQTEEVGVGSAWTGETEWALVRQRQVVLYLPDMQLELVTGETPFGVKVFKRSKGYRLDKDSKQEWSGLEARGSGRQGESLVSEE